MLTDFFVFFISITTL